MKTTTLAKGFLLGGMTLVMAVGAFAQDEPPVMPEPPAPLTYPVTVGHDSATLNEDEKLIIEQKREALVKYLYEQQMLESSRNLLKSRERQEAKVEAQEKTFPMTPAEIVDTREKGEQVERARNAPLPGKAINFSIRTMELDMNSTRPVELRVVRGYASSLVFFDENGSPWPLVSDASAHHISNGEAYAAKITSPEGNVVIFDIKQAFVESNAIVMLQGIPVPIVIRLVGDDQGVDARLSVRIPKPGPLAPKMLTYRDQVQNVTSEMMAVLNNDKLPNQRRLRLEGVAGEVLFDGTAMYVRTNSTVSLINPAPVRELSTELGYKVYQLRPTVNLLFEVNGEMKEGKVVDLFEATLTREPSVFEKPAGSDEP